MSASKVSTQSINILAIESSCDDTAAAVLRNGEILSNKVATQAIHAQYGGVVPELASRAHMSNIIPVVDAALKEANIDRKDIDAIAFTQSPGLIGSLMVGASFAKAFAQASNIPLIAVHHMQAHVLAHFIVEPKPQFPFLCLTVSGGHTQLVLCHDYLKMEVLGETLDDAAGEAFDKTAKMLGLPYPGGPLVDKYAKEGDPLKFKFSTSSMPGLSFSFSGLKTSVLYFLQKEQKKNPDFIKENLVDICASVQYSIIKMLMDKLIVAAKQSNVKHVGIAGGVSANSGLRKALQEIGTREGWEVFIPDFQYCTDNAAMIAIAAWYKYQLGEFAELDVVPSARAVWS
ncbi:MAG: tRNA (adenosine(37)-N6)-threonylcarbamoyltransferase complex transferase subunit TsaD [Chitinophagaceae bacterium]